MFRGVAVVDAGEQTMSVAVRRSIEDYAMSDDGAR
jgi:hypothetical protein